MSSKLIECVPNISEGRDADKIKLITDVVHAVEGVKLLDVDPGKTTNRTVITFVGAPDPVLEAAFLLVKKAAEVIDMKQQTGEHPRMGATDVCPLVPIAGITMEETVAYARKLAERIGKELAIPVYCYENAALSPERKNLANCRSGEYEGLKEKFTDSKWHPDFGPNKYSENVAKTGATAVGARDFLVAYNVNLNTTSTRRANAIAFDIRERGRVKREGGTLTGKIIKDDAGNPISIPGTLKAVKGIGWYIEEYGIAQLSLNLTNISITSVHQAFEEAVEKSRLRGIRVTGSELVGLIPLKAMLDAGKYFLKKQQRSIGVSESELIKIAVKSLGLDDLSPFNPQDRIIEYVLKDKGKKQLVDMDLTAFADETASESPAPGGGSISAYVGAMGIALATMVANLSAHKRGWDDRWEAFSAWAEKGQRLQSKLLLLVDEDTQSFNRIMDAFGLSKGNDAEKASRKAAIQHATKEAIEVPFQVMKTSLEAMDVVKAMAETGNPNSVTDAGVGALCCRTAIRGAFLNVKINAVDLEDKAFVEKVIKEGALMEEKAEVLEKEVMVIVASKL